MTVHDRRPAPARWGWLDERSAAGIALGVAGLFMFNIVCGPFAIGLGFFAYRRASRRPAKVAALVSVVLGLADLIVLAVLVASKVHDGQFQLSG